MYKRGISLPIILIASIILLILIISGMIGYGVFTSQNLPGKTNGTNSNLEAYPECEDGIDNDNDILVDLADPGCLDYADNSELNDLEDTSNTNTNGGSNSGGTSGGGGGGGGGNNGGNNNNPPVLSVIITSPIEDASYSTNVSILLNFTISGANGSVTCNYNINSGPNVSIPSCMALYFNASNGNHTVRVNVRDNSRTATDNSHFSVVNSSNSPVCGNNVIENGEVCDGNSQTCQINGYNGIQNCLSNCLGFGLCIANESCGDGIRNGPEQCDDGNANNNDTCNNLCQLNPLPTCQLTSASWSRSSVIEGQGVNLIVTGSNCLGQLVSFVVWEDDPIGGDDPVNINPVNVPFIGNIANGSWIAEWQDDGIGNPEYYFIASLVLNSSKSIQSELPLLDVSQSPVQNNPPILNPIGNKNVSEGNLLQFTLNYSDSDGNSVFCLPVQNLPPGASFNTGTCTFSWTPNSTQSGTYNNVLFTIEDNGSPPMQDSEAISITVNDVGVQQFALLVSKTGSGGGTVTSLPVGINCGSDCFETYNAGTLVSLSAMPNLTSTFIGWSGACSGNGSCQIVMNSNVNLIAQFGTETSTPECSDGLDNDNDGAIDVGNDFSCINAIDDDETNPRAQCQNGMDDDGDSLADLNDPGCSGNQDNDESNPVGTANECTDGQDNDEDGQADFLDSGCFLVNGQETNNNYGFTLFSPSADTRIVYVSSSQGSDSNDGLTPETPKRTIAAGYALLRNGFPDWLLLKRGDTWTAERLGESPTGSWKKSGRNVNEMMIVGSYGGSIVRPMIKIGSGIGWSNRLNWDGSTNDFVNNFGIVGIHIYAHTRDPDSSEFTGINGGTGLDRLVPGSNFLIEDCRFDYAGISMDIGPDELQNFKFRRNVVFGNYPDSGHAQGIFVSHTNGILLEENVFDNNGWNEELNAGPTQFNHNVYISNANTGLVVRGNIFSRASATGIQARPGGIVEDNLFAENPLSLNFGWSTGGGSPPHPDGYQGFVRNNVFFGGPSRGFGTWGIVLGNLNDEGYTEVSNNIWAQADASNNVGIHLDGGNNAGIGRLNFTNNIVSNWNRAVNVIGVPGTDIINTVINSNIFQDPVYGDYPSVRFRDAAVSQNTMQSMAFSNNNYFNVRSANAWFEDDSGDFSFSTWISRTQESGASNQEVQFFDSDRDLGDYDATVGGNGNFASFIQEAKEQGKFNRREEYTAYEVNEYIRDGFVIIGLSPPEKNIISVILDAIKDLFN